jgi:hypothetical protein
VKQLRLGETAAALAKRLLPWRKQLLPWRRNGCCLAETAAALLKRENGCCLAKTAAALAKTAATLAKQLLPWRRKRLLPC